MADSEDNNAAESAPQQTKGGPWNLIAIVAILTLIAIVLVPGEENKPADNPPIEAPAPSLLQPEAAVPENTSADATAKPAEQATAAPTPKAAGAAARELIAQLRQQNPPDLDAAFAAARQHQQAGRIEDAYLLYFYAAREGHGEAALTMGRQIDPAHFEQGGLVKRADELQAHKWYSKASAAGVAAANDALAALRAQVEDAAADGDDRARRIMLQWK